MTESEIIELVKKLKQLKKQWREQFKTQRDLEMTFKQDENYCMAQSMSARGSQLQDCINSLTEIIG